MRPSTTGWTGKRTERWGVAEQLSAFGGNIAYLDAVALVGYLDADSRFHPACRLMANHGLLPRDAIHVAVARRLGITAIVSDDDVFDQIPGIRLYKP